MRNSVDFRGTINRRGDMLYIRNALVEEVFSGQEGAGYLLISYAARERNGAINIELIRLNVDGCTSIMDQFGMPVDLHKIEKGMWVDAEFSPAMTRSIPPQSRACRIIVQSDRTKIMITSDRVVKVDVKNRFIYTGNPRNTADQMKFAISDATLIIDRRGNPIALRDIKPGMVVRVKQANFQTLSIPPQSTAFLIQLMRK